MIIDNIKFQMSFLSRAFLVFCKLYAPYDTGNLTEHAMKESHTNSRASVHYNSHNAYYIDALEFDNLTAFGNINLNKGFIEDTAAALAGYIETSLNNGFDEADFVSKRKWMKERATKTKSSFFNEDRTGRLKESRAISRAIAFGR